MPNPERSHNNHEEEVFQFDQSTGPQTETTDADVFFPEARNAASGPEFEEEVRKFDHPDQIPEK